MLSVLCSRLERKRRLKRINTGNDKEKKSVDGKDTQRFDFLEQKGFLFPTLFVY